MDSRENPEQDIEKTSPVYTYLRICSTFGITLAMNIYLLSHLLGGWLDRTYETSVLFRVIFLFIALVTSFYYLYRRVIASEKIEKEQQEIAEQTADETRSLNERIEALRKELKR